MRNEPVTMNDFAESVREELQNDLGVLFPGIKVVVQQVDKIQEDSYLGVRIDRQDGISTKEKQQRQALKTGSITRKIRRKRMMGNWWLPMNVIPVLPGRNSCWIGEDISLRMAVNASRM